VQAEPPHWLDEISLSKTPGHHFSPWLMKGAEIWGHSRNTYQQKVQLCRTKIQHTCFEHW
jgi:hypothetical protein